MLTMPELSEQATAICREQAEKILQGELLIETQSTELEWDKVQMRNVFAQDMAIWQRYGGFDVIVDDNGRIAGFVDYDKYEQSNEAALSHDEINAIVADADLIPLSAKMVELKAVELAPSIHTLRATYALRHPTKWYTHFEVEINPARRAVIAVRPLNIQGA